MEATVFGVVRFRAMHERPYLASALASLIPIEVSGLPQPMSADQHWRLYYDPVQLEAWNVETAAGALLHLVTHLIRAHGERGSENLAIPDLWGLGGDEEINDDILTEEDITTSGGLALPDDAITPTTFGHPAGETVEQYYGRLIEELPPAGAGDGEDAGSDGNGEDAGRDAEDAGSEVAKNRDDDAGAKPPPGFGGAGCGSCATGAPMEWEQPYTPAHERETGHEEAEGISKAEANLIRRNTARQIKEASQSRGEVPEGWQRWAHETLDQPFDFKRMFSRMIRGAMGHMSGMVDYTYRRPSRRQSTHRNVIMPSMVAPKIIVGVIVDTSASMSDTMIGQALAICRGALEAASLIKVCSCDSAVHDCQTVFRPQDIRVFGGGGTDMRIPIRYFEEMKHEKPSLVLCVTDGFTPWPNTAPRGFNFITLLTCGSGHRPPFGDTYVWDQNPAHEM